MARNASVNRTEFTTDVLESLDLVVGQELAWSEIPDIGRRVDQTGRILRSIESVGFLRLAGVADSLNMTLLSRNLVVTLTNQVGFMFCRIDPF